MESFSLSLSKMNCFFISKPSLSIPCLKSTFLPATAPFIMDIFIHDDDDSIFWSWKALTTERTQCKNLVIWGVWIYSIPKRKKKKSASLFLTSLCIWYWSTLPGEEVLLTNNLFLLSFYRQGNMPDTGGNITKGKDMGWRYSSRWLVFVSRGWPR